MLTAAQVAAIIILLQAFGVSPSVISVVKADITPTAYIAPTQPYIPPVVQSPIQTPTTPVAPVLGATAPTVSSCSTTPVVSLSFDNSLINLETNQGGWIEITANAVDQCERPLIYDLYAGGQPLKLNVNINSDTGTTTIGVSGNNIYQWETQNGFSSPDWDSFPVSVFTEGATTTEYISVE